MNTTHSWLNRTVLGAGLTSFLADIGHEMATVMLPGFLVALGLPVDVAARAIGFIEGFADLLSNGVKLAIGWYSDRIGQRKPFVVAGYAMTGTAFALCALAASWPLILVAKSLAWIGKGLRGPLRNAILAGAVEPAHRGKAFGFHRAGDTLGAIVGPLIAAGLIIAMPREWFSDAAGSYRLVFLLTLIPGIGSALTFALLIREQRFTPKPGLRFVASLVALPRGFRRYLVGVGLFGIGDFSHTLLVLTAGMLLTPEHGQGLAAAMAMTLYAWKNAIGALAALPAGWLGDRCGHRHVLVGGYVLGAATIIGFLILIITQSASLLGLGVLFAGAGCFLAIEEAIEPTITAELIADASTRGTAYGMLASVNGLGDFVASVGVGFLFVLGPEVGFAAAAGFMLAGAAWTALFVHTGDGAPST